MQIKRMKKSKLNISQCTFEEDTYLETQTDNLHSSRTLNYSLIKDKNLCHFFPSNYPYNSLNNHKSLSSVQCNINKLDLSLSRMSYTKRETFNINNDESDKDVLSDKKAFSLCNTIEKQTLKTPLKLIDDNLVAL